MYFWFKPLKLFVKIASFLQFHSHQHVITKLLCQFSSIECKLEYVKFHWINCLSLRMKNFRMATRGNNIFHTSYAIGQSRTICELSSFLDPQMAHSRRAVILLLHLTSLERILFWSRSQMNVLTYCWIFSPILPPILSSSNPLKNWNRYCMLMKPKTFQFDCHSRLALLLWCIIIECYRGQLQEYHHWKQGAKIIPFLTNTVLPVVHYFGLCCCHRGLSEGRRSQWCIFNPCIFPEIWREPIHDHPSYTFLKDRIIVD